jgi:hypothetical protein
MTVQDLIDELQNYPPDMILVQRAPASYRGGDYWEVSGVQEEVTVHYTTYGGGTGLDEGTADGTGEYESGPSFVALEIK